MSERTHTNIVFNCLDSDSEKSDIGRLKENLGDNPFRNRQGGFTTHKILFHLLKLPRHMRTRLATTQDVLCLTQSSSFCEFR